MNTKNKLGGLLQRYARSTPSLHSSPARGGGKRLRIVAKTQRPQGEYGTRKWN